MIGLCCLYARKIAARVTVHALSWLIIEVLLKFELLVSWQNLLFARAPLVTDDYFHLEVPRNKCDCQLMLCPRLSYQRC